MATPLDLATLFQMDAQMISNLRTPYEGVEINILVFRDSSASQPSEEFSLSELYPFQTLHELSTAIYEQSGKRPEYHPNFQCLLVPPVQSDATEQTPNGLPISHMWKIGKSIVYLKNPYERARAARADEKFVNAVGESKAIEFQNRRELLIEDLVNEIFQQRQSLNISTEEPILLHLYLYQDISASIVAKPISEIDWKGKIIPYFPFLTREQDSGDLPPAMLQEATLQSERLLARLAALNHLNELLQSSPIPPLTFAGLRHLRLQWNSSSKQQSLETTFYESDVSHQIPFMRLFPTTGAPVSKVHVQGVLPRPSLEDPQILTQWAQEKSPIATHDFMISKLLVRPAIGQATPPLYATLRIFEEGSADFILQPPKQIRKIDPRTDLATFSELLDSTLPRFNLNPLLSQLTDISCYLSLRLPRESPRITRSSLLKKLPIFRAFFQETTPLSGDTPLLSLRFKGVSNFTTEDRIHSFLTQINRRKLLQGEALTHQLVSMVKEEFQLSEKEARKRVIDWFEKSDDVVIKNTETLEYGAAYNPGTDIALYAQHPFYSFHIYRADSVLTFRRVLTLLTMFIGLQQEDLQIEGVVKASLEEEEKEDHLEAAIEAAAGGGAAQLPPGAAAAVEDADELDAALEYVPEGLLDLAADVDVPEGDGVEPELPAAVSVREVVAAEKPAPALEAAGAAVVSGSAAPAAPDNNASNAGGADEEDSDETTDPARLKDVPAATYFIQRLKLYDRTLFDYSKKHPHAKKYVRQCGSTLVRQPTVMNYDEYQSMKETYADDPVVFIEYGPDKTDYPDIPKGYEAITVLEYGSNLLQPNYYICSKYWCKQDEIVVLEKDFLATVDRNSPPRPKPKYTCPFCRGKLASRDTKEDRARSTKGETVLERIPHPRKPGKDVRHLMVGFLKKQAHPEGLFLPCCFVPPKSGFKSIPKTHPAFAPFTEKARLQALQAAPELVEEEEAAAEAAGKPGNVAVEEGLAPSAVRGAPELEVRVVDFFGKLQKLHRSYILSSEKLPLEVTDEPQVGLLPNVLDRYFEQNPDAIVERTFTTMNLKENSRGFLRVGVENTQRSAPESFLAALAPFLLKQNAAQVKSRILEVVRPRIFMNLNYGNFLLEFYDPSTPITDSEEPTEEEIDKVLKSWASTELLVNFSSANRAALLRALKSYTAFVNRLQDPSDRKEYRQFAELLATPGLLTPRGLVFLVLDVSKKGELSVRCPAYGVRPDLAFSADIGILFHHESGIWEPIVYTENRAQTKSFMESHEVSLVFQRDQEAAWPPILRKRIAEFFYSCRGPGRAVYTSESRINPAALLPISRAIKQSKVYPEGVIRDAYNHIGALTFSVSPGSKSLVVLPVADDGTLKGLTLNLHLDWDDIKPAPADEVIQFYRENFKSILSLYPGYEFMVTLYNREDNKPMAIQLANGLKIPVSPTRIPDIPLPGPKKEKVYATLMEWQLNKQLIYDTSDEPLKKEVKSRELEEIYQHLRLTFANWLASEAAGPTVRRDIEAIVSRRDLLLFERRKRMEILLGSTVLGWLDSTTPIPGKRSTAAILRVDCLAKGAEEDCKGRCVWSRSDNRCALHVDPTATIGEREIDAPTLLLHRLIEELLRFQVLREELLKNKVNRIITLHDAVRIEDQYIIPESTPAWTEMLRLEWLKPKEEHALFHEELSGGPTAPAAAVAALKPLPAELSTFLGITAESPLNTPLALFTPRQEEGAPPLTPFLSYFDLSSSDITEDDIAFSDAILGKIVRKTRSAFIQVDFSGGAPQILVRNLIQSGNPNPSVIFLYISSEGVPSILVEDPKQPGPLPFDSLPSSLQEILKKAKAVMIKA